MPVLYKARCLKVKQKVLKGKGLPCASWVRNEEMVGRSNKRSTFFFLIDVGTKYREQIHLPAALSSRNESSTFNG